MSKSDGSTAEYTGGSVSYYTVSITNPTTEGVKPYQAECNDIIEALGMSYAEGNAFKALWRRAAAQNLGAAKAGYKDGLYDAEKVVFFGQRLVAQHAQDSSCASGGPISSDAVYLAGEQFDDFGAPLPLEPVASIDDDSARMQAIGQNGNTGEHYDESGEWYPSAPYFPEWADCEVEGAHTFAKHFASMDSEGRCFSERGRMFNMNRWTITKTKKDAI